MLVFLHTSSLHIARFDKILAELNCKDEIKHVVNEDLLISTLQGQGLDEIGFTEEISKIRLYHEGLIVCTCSTYGALASSFTNVKRIDLPVAQFLVKNFVKIGIAYTVETTKLISKDLIENEAEKLNKSILVSFIDCSVAWKYFEVNDIEKYNNEIKHIIEKSLKFEEVVFLAQASMDGVENLSSSNIKLTSSTKIGIQEFLKYSTEI